MAGTEVEIANLALALIGESEIASFDEPSVAAKVMKLHYPNTRDWVLRRHPWNAALRQVSLTKTVSTPAFGYDAEYLLPGEPNFCLRVLSIDPDYDSTQLSKGRNTAPFMIQGRKLYANILDGISLTYIQRLTNVSDMDALLIDVIASKLAMDVVYSLTGSSTNLQLAQGRFDDTLRSARAIDSREQGRFFDDSSTITSRLGTDGRLY